MHSEQCTHSNNNLDSCFVREFRVWRVWDNFEFDFDGKRSPGESHDIASAQSRSAPVAERMWVQWRLSSKCFYKLENDYNAGEYYSLNTIH